jgi:hypothetical protein
MEASEFLRIYRRRAPQIMWLLGAGASASASVPTAWAMTWDFKRLICSSLLRVPPESLGPSDDPVVQDRLQQQLDALGGFPPRGADDENAVYFEAAFSDEADRRAYIEDCQRGAAPSAGHYALAALLHQDHARVVWTTNFDRLIEGAAVRVYGPSNPLRVAWIQTSDIARDAPASARAGRAGGIRSRGAKWSLPCPLARHWSHSVRRPVVPRSFLSPGQAARILVPGPFRRRACDAPARTRSCCGG